MRPFLNFLMSPRCIGGWDDIQTAALFGAVRSPCLTSSCLSAPCFFSSPCSRSGFFSRRQTQTHTRTLRELQLEVTDHLAQTFCKGCNTRRENKLPVRDNGPQNVPNSPTTLKLPLKPSPANLSFSAVPPSSTVHCTCRSPRADLLPASCIYVRARRYITATGRRPPLPCTPAPCPVTAKRKRQRHAWKTQCGFFELGQTENCTKLY